MALLLPLLATLLLAPALWIAATGINEHQPGPGVMIARTVLLLMAVGFVVDLWIG